MLFQDLNKVYLGKNLGVVVKIEYSMASIASSLVLVVVGLF